MLICRFKILGGMGWMDTKCMRSTHGLMVVAYGGVFLISSLWRSIRVGWESWDRFVDQVQFEIGDGS
jgi:drug/metabolite transporter superfamily protein YnfA